MVKFSLTLKDTFSDITIEGDSEVEILENIKQIQSIKEKSDKILGYDIKIPVSIVNQMKNFEYSERIMLMLYFADRKLTRQELHDRNSLMMIRKSWWGGSNFSRDLGKKISTKLIIESKDEKPNYALTKNGIKYIKKMLVENDIMLKKTMSEGDMS